MMVKTVIFDNTTYKKNKVIVIVRYLTRKKMMRKYFTFSRKKNSTIFDEPPI